ncbi:hypothetical protein CYMTET_38824 [Cymbomonas tetramitiformis]|uniref:Uncharacterized protein n=1 Tax=Cymbomonas tetramitiformis TaxID=36881 RepID=A0AAE0CDB7_9CHLO|nr:hypothetical protein CYMTET_38824 [Cymbomonas tetramitiformis]
MRLLRSRSAPAFVDQNPEPDPEDDQRLVVRLEDLAEELSRTVHTDSTQPDFTVKSLGMLPNGDNNDPTVVWLIARNDLESPLGFGTKAAIEDFWQVPDEITERVFPEAANDMDLVKRNLFFKAERANLSNNAAFAIGLFLQTVEMSNRYKLVCGEAEEEVTELLTLNAPRQLPSFLTNPVLIEQVCQLPTHLLALVSQGKSTKGHLSRTLRRAFGE